MILFRQTRYITEYRPIIDTMIPDFGPIFLHTLLQWCRLAHDPYEKGGQFWELWLVKRRLEAIGICGLYSLKPTLTDELWLGWMGIVPQLRNEGIGKEIMRHLYNKAAEAGCSVLRSYVDKDGKPLNFYRREGFKVLGTVKEYLEANKMQQIDGDSFEDPSDWVIEKQLK